MARTKMIQVRSVPASLHRELTKRAQARGMTLTAYVEEILEREVARPSRQDVFAQIASHPPVNLGRPAATLIHEERKRRTR